MSQQQHGTIGVQITNHVATLTLNNPTQYNALTKDMCLELVGAFSGLSVDPQVRAILITGAGANFSAGIAIDQMDLVLFDEPVDGELVNHFDLVDRAITSCPKPTIAVVRGNCFGGAWQLASACDIQLAADTTRLAITRPRLGWFSRVRVWSVWCKPWGQAAPNTYSLAARKSPWSKPQPGACLRRWSPRRNSKANWRR